jgi:hypothetical protein
MSKKSKSIVVTIADDAVNDIDAVAARLSEKGLKVERVLRGAGVITGSSTAGKVPGLAKVSGVKSVEEEAVAELPPPSESPQ